MPTTSQLAQDLGYKRFAKEYVRNGFNGTQAVKEVWPRISEPAMRVKASRLITKDNVVSEVLRNLPSLDSLADDLELAKQLTLKKGDFPNHLRALEDQVKMHGGFKENKEVTHKHHLMKPQEQQEVIDLKANMLEIEDVT